MSIEIAIRSLYRYVLLRGWLTHLHRKALAEFIEQDDWWNIRADHAVAHVTCMDSRGEPVGFAMLEGCHEGPAEFWDRVSGKKSAEIGSVQLVPSIVVRGLLNS